MPALVPEPAEELEVFRSVVKTVPIEVVDIQAGDVARREEVPGHEAMEPDMAAVPGRVGKDLRVAPSSHAPGDLSPRGSQVWDLRCRYPSAAR
jgi:hypothetical protein